MPFLSYFSVPRPIRCGFMSAEIGWGTLRERAEQVAQSKGFALAELDNLHWSTACPIVSNFEHLGELERFICDQQLQMLGIDPSYLAFCDVADKASNPFAMGRVLLGLTRLIETTGSTINLQNHNRKNRGEAAKYYPPSCRKSV